MAREDAATLRTAIVEAQSARERLQKELHEYRTSEEHMLEQMQAIVTEHQAALAARTCDYISYHSSDE